MKSFALALLGILFVFVITFIVMSYTNKSETYQFKAAQETTVEKLDIRGLGRVDYQYLFTEVSEKGESLDDFALRISPRLRAFSDETQFEACGVLATDGTTFGVVVGTNRSHIACANFFASRLPAGMKATEQTIHSHGVDRRFTANKNDLALQGQVFFGRAGIKTVEGQELDAFSDKDFDGGPGYLAAPNGVTLHQSGKRGTTRKLSRVVPAVGP